MSTTRSYAVSVIKNASEAKFLEILDEPANFDILFNEEHKDINAALREKINTFSFLEKSLAAVKDTNQRIELIRKLGREYFHEQIPNTESMIHIIKLIPAAYRFTFFELMYLENNKINTRTKDLYEIGTLMLAEDKNNYIYSLPSPWVVYLAIFLSRLGSTATEEFCAGMDDIIANLVAHPVIAVCYRVRQMQENYNKDPEQTAWGIFSPLISTHHEHFNNLLDEADKTLLPLTKKCKTQINLDYANDALRELVGKLERALLAQIAKFECERQGNWLKKFADYLDEENNKHHYSRLLFITLKAIYLYQPAASLLNIPTELRDIIHIELKTPKTPTYTSFTSLSQIGQKYELQQFKR